ncbi:cation/H(+) antiporter 15-like [Rhododendron vialii]|uniref:cation/H(+) antiporter 15-like n=1 Tax=Rhododendron vialii TaxID=182163 RepID=UPI0026602E30|nr:cation/H(+) antiporter 15-like [Rhododendron vialii]
MTTNAPNGVVLPFNFSAFDVPFSCEYFASAVTSGGYFRNDNPIRHPVPFFLSQLGVGTILCAIFRLLLRPLKQPRFVAEMLAGIMLGPSMFKLFGKGDYIESLKTIKEYNMINVLEYLGLTTFSFVVGVRTDISMLKSAGKLPWIIGILSFLLPMSVVFPAAALFKKYLGEMEGFFLYWVSVMAAKTSFQVTSVLLEDLSLLNSELGRLALSSALISSIGSWIFATYNAYYAWSKRLKFRTLDYFRTEIPRAISILAIIFVLRPFMFWLMRRIPEGRPIKESHFFVITVMFLTVSFAYECLGFGAPLGAMILGLCVPPGRPLGSGVVEKLEAFISAVLLPTYIVGAGRYVDIFQISMVHYIQAEIIILLSFSAKLAAGVIPSVICRMPYKDSFALGLLLSAQGFFDVLFFKLFHRYGVLTQEFYSVLTLMAVLTGAVTTPLIYYLYNPSKRYSNYKRRTIQQSRHENELRILLCLHEEDQVCSLMNVLKASYPTREKPVGAFVLDLIELVGRDHPLLINHQFHQRRSTTLTRTDRIINAFNQYELRSEGTIKHQHYTSITPYVSMHDDICTLALEKRTSILIFPFQKSDNSPIPGVIKNVLDKAPCSVGILFDKKIITHWRSDSHNQARLSVCVVFLGGPDAREALAYGMRMVANPAIRLTVLRLIAEDEFVSDMLETRHDIDLIQELRAAYNDTQRIEYREEIVRDGVETSKVILSLDDRYDFMLVGRRLDSDSPLVKGLADWSHAQELGIIGDMLASSDMKCSASVLVVQQQFTVEDLAHAHED